MVPQALCRTGADILVHGDHKKPDVYDSPCWKEAAGNGSLYTRVMGPSKERRQGCIYELQIFLTQGEWTGDTSVGPPEGK